MSSRIKPKSAQDRWWMARDFVFRFVTYITLFGVILEKLLLLQFVMNHATQKWCCFQSLCWIL